MVSDDRHEPPWADLDEGIRETVMLLWNAGFEPTDSGDGRRLGTKADMDEALDVPHVFMVCAGDDLIDEANRLQRVAEDAGVVKAGEVLVQATYSPDDGVGVIALYGRLP